MALNADYIAKMPLIQKLAILGALVVVIVTLYYFVWHVDYDKTLTKRKDDLREVKTELVNRKAIAKEKDKLKREVARLKKQLEEAKKRLPTSAEVDKLLITLDDLGRENGLNFTTFQPDKSKSKSLYSEVPVKLSFKGNYHHILRFFDEVSKLDRIISISSLKITKKGKSGSLLSVDCVAVTYTFKE